MQAEIRHLDKLITAARFSESYTDDEEGPKRCLCRAPRPQSIPVLTKNGAVCACFIQAGRSLTVIEPPRLCSFRRFPIAALQTL